MNIRQFKWSGTLQESPCLKPLQSQNSFFPYLRPTRASSLATSFLCWVPRYKVILQVGLSIFALHSLVPNWADHSDLPAMRKLLLVRHDFFHLEGKHIYVVSLLLLADMSACFSSVIWPSASNWSFCTYLPNTTCMHTGSSRMWV